METTITTKKNNLKDFNLNLDKLYNNDYQINVHLSDKDFTFYLILKDVHDKVDFKLSSIRANLWTRSNKGINYEKYNRIQDIQVAIKRLIKNKIDSTKGQISFSISKNIGFI